MNKVIIAQGQSLMDFTNKHCGSLDRLIEVALVNGLAITDHPKAGTELLVPDVQTDVTKYFITNGIVPAAAHESSEPDGINYMAVEVDFIIQ